MLFKKTVDSIVLRFADMVQELENVANEKAIESERLQDEVATLEIKIADANVEVKRARLISANINRLLGQS